MEEDDAIFRVTPLNSIPELRAHAQSLSVPPVQGSRVLDLVNLRNTSPLLHFDIRYATIRNFLSTPVYESDHQCLLQRDAAKAIMRVLSRVQQHGFSLLVYDAFRPWWVTYVFWHATEERHHHFVADPAEGSRHNRGCAIDLTLCDPVTGSPADMPSGYDEFSERAYANYAGGTEVQRRNRDLLRDCMEQEGFTVLPEEWWHFDYKDWEQYPLSNLTI